MKKFKVLLVEDDPTMQGLLTKICDFDPQNIFVQMSALSLARDYLGQADDAGAPYDLVVVFSSEKETYNFLREASRQKILPPFVLVSTFVPPDFVRMDEYCLHLPKPHGLPFLRWVVFGAYQQSLKHV